VARVRRGVGDIANSAGKGARPPDQEEHRHPKGGKPENRMDQLPDGAQEEHEPNWHKEGRKAPPGWKPSGDTFVEE